MPRANIFAWRDGAGWLVLSGGGEAASEVEALALAKVPPGEPIAYVWAAGDIDHADRHLAALEDSGAPTGYLVDVQTEDDDTIRARISDAGLIILGDGPELGALRGGIAGAAADGMATAYARGSVILGIGAGAAVLGAKYAGKDGTLRDGLGWLEHAIIVPHYEPARDAATIRALLTQVPDALGLGIAQDSALAFGGAVESWGETEMSVTLGAAFKIITPTAPESESETVSDPDDDQGEL